MEIPNYNNFFSEKSTNVVEFYYNKILNSTMYDSKNARFVLYLFILIWNSVLEKCILSWMSTCIWFPN